MRPSSEPSPAPLSTPAPLPTPSPDAVALGCRLLEPLAAYHRLEVHGLEHMPRTGPALWVAHHTLATYDGFLVGVRVVQATGRLPRALGDRRIFDAPGLGPLAHRLGIVRADPEAGLRLLQAGELVAVAPGGMWEALRPRQERYRTRWEGRLGFCRLALRAQAPLVLSACPRADELYTVYPSRLTDRAYERLHLPLPLLRGLGPTLLPRPLKLHAWIAPPIPVPAHDPAHEDEQAEELHRRASAVMAELLGRR